MFETKRPEETPELLALLEVHLEVDADHLELGYWDCPGSPTGFCVYDTDDDPVLDCCLICHHPDERK